jgi:dTDP-4-dehydrorhamnose reductase
MKILITGANGQLGRSLRTRLEAHEVLSLAHGDLDVTDAGACGGKMEAHRPDAVVHCAALTDTARCEKEPSLAREVNGIGTENVARACARFGARLVAISTNEVFDGAKSSPYTEDDRPNPLNAYALSKLDGESLAMAVHRDTMVVRTSWLYGAGYVNFNDKVLAAAGAGKPLAFVTDEVAAPTSTNELATAIRDMLESDAPPGVYHLANEGESSRYEWAREILRLARVDAPIDAVTTEELRANGYQGPRKAPYSVLANRRAAAMGIRLREWREALADHFEARATAHIS